MVIQSRPRGLFLVWIIAAVMSSGAATVAAGSDAASISFGIDTVQNAMQGETVTVPVYKLSGTRPFYGFDFLIVYDTVTLTLAGVTPGEVFDIPGSYEWEYFSYSADSSGIPTGLIRSTGVADIVDGDHHPAAHQIPDSAVMFTLEFTVTPDSAYNCTWNPILFYWKDCGDNALALDSPGTELGISNRVYVYGYAGYMDITDPGAGFPGIYGAPDDCLTGPAVTREIDYYGGGIDIHCTEEIDDRGDVNCNGVQYEIADFVMFANYFLVGIDAFGEHAGCSQDNSDANADGVELQLEDLIYLYRVIVGDAVPYPKTYPGDIIPVTFTQDNDAKTISLDYEDSLAAIQLAFEGDITPTVLIGLEGVSWSYQFDGVHTRVVILPDDFVNRAPHFIADGTFLTYTGDALLVEARAADYYDHVFHASIESFGSGITIPYTFEIGQIPNAPLGSTVSIPVVKKTGSEEVGGFDFVLGYDESALTITEITPGALFDIPGAFEWESLYTSWNIDCFDPNCPSGLIRVIGLADTGIGGHHPLDPEIPDGTTLFTLECEVTIDLTYEELFIPMRYFWTDCGVNGVAFGSPSTLLAVSDHVYDYDGIEITDRDFGLPGYHGVPDSCFDNPDNPPRFANFRNGGVHIVSIDSMKLLVTIDSVAADPGDTTIYVDVHLSNPQDSIAGFSLHVVMSRPDLVEFGRSPDDTIALDIENTLISDWEFIHQRSLSGTHHDVRIDAISNSIPPYTKGIPPGYDGILLRLVVHSYADIPEIVIDSTTRLMIDELPDQTGFSDPNGILIGLSGMQYDSMTVSFRDGFVTIEGPIPGDADGDGTVNLSDAVFIVVYIFNGGPAPDPLCLGDADCDGVVNISDAVYIINYVFKGGDPPVPGCCP